MVVGPCAKLTTTAVIKTTDGQTYIGQNWCANPQQECPRGNMPTGTGYELCREVCHQIGHAEVVACMIAGEAAKGATMYLAGHYYACDNCKRVAKEHGIKEIIVDENNQRTLPDV